MNYFADSITDALANSGLGGSATLIIVILLAAIGVIFRLYLKALKDKDDLQEKRLVETKEVNTSLIEPFKEVTELTRKTNNFITDVLPSIMDKRRR